MSDALFSARLHRFDTEDEATNWSIDWLRERGFVVTRPNNTVEMISPGELRKRLGLKSATFTKRLHHFDCPDFHARLSPSKKRLIGMVPNARLIRWLTAPLQAGKRLKL